MNWLLIVMIAGQFSFAEILDTKTECGNLGNAQVTQHAEVTFVCLTTESLLQISE